MRIKDYCVYYDDISEECQSGGKCAGAMCKHFVSVHTRTDCKFYDEKRNICRALVGNYPPCSRPRMSKKTGRAVLCTFYEKKGK